MENKKVFAGYSDGKIYKGTFDITPNEIETIFQNEYSYSKIISDTGLIKHHDLLSHLPNPIPFNRAETLDYSQFESTE